MEWENHFSPLTNPTINLLAEDDTEDEIPRVPDSLDNLIRLLRPTPTLDDEKEIPIAQGSSIHGYSHRAPFETPHSPRTSTLGTSQGNELEIFYEKPQPIQSKKKLQVQLKNLIKLLRHPTRGVPVKDRPYYLTTYPDCFVAFEFVEWLVHHRVVENRKQATRIGTELFEMNLIEHVAPHSNVKCFKDDYFFYRWNEESPFLKSIPPFSEKEEQNVIVALTRATKGEDFATPSWVSFTPINIFTAPMGTAGLGLLWKKLQKIWPIMEDTYLCDILLVFAALLFVGCLLLYGIKSVLHFKTVQYEWRHNTLSNLFSAISVTLLLFAAALVELDIDFAFAVWVPGTLLSTFFALEAAAQWAIRGRTLSQFNPTYFLPIVTLVLVPMAGVHFGLTRLSWAFWGVGSFYWLVLFTLFFLRIIFVGMIPPHLVPCLYIAVAPPAIIANSFFVLTKNEYPAVSATLWGINIFMFILMTRLRMTQKSVPFSLSAWAYTFPLSASALASAQFHLQLPGTMAEKVVSQVINVIMSLVATSAWVLVFVGTIIYLINRRIFLPSNRFHSTEDDCD